MKKKNTKDKTKKKRKWGFTLIEILAVIIILGILTLIAVPAVSQYIDDSKRSSYIKSAKGIINGARNIANSAKLDMNDPNVTYYIPAKYIKTENDLQSPYGNFTEAYVGVITDNDKHSYYWISNDSSTHGIKKVTNQDKLENDLIEEQIKDIEITETVEKTGIRDRNRIWILNLDGTWQAERIAKYNVDESGEIEPADTMLAIFIDGLTFNDKIKKLANGNDVTYYSVDNRIKTLKRSETEPTDNNKQEKNIVSSSNSEVPIYAWFDNGTLYWWSEDYKPNLNADASIMFYNLQGLREIELNKIKTNLTTNMAALFKNCKSLKTIDVSTFDTSNVTNMMAMFDVEYRWGSGAVVSETTEIVGLKNFDTRKVKYMSEMFHGQIKIKNLDLRSFDTSNVEQMGAMFGNCLSLENVNLTSFNTSNVTNMGAMFQHTSSLATLDLTSFDTSKVTNFGYMFGCGGNSELCKLKTIKGIEKFNTSSVTDMKLMFVHQTSLRTLDLSGWDTSNVTDMEGMFAATNLITIYASPSFKTDRVQGSEHIFLKSSNYAYVSNSYVLTGGAGTTYSDSHIDKEYARIDDPEHGKPGYFTLKTN